MVHPVPRAPKRTPLSLARAYERAKIRENQRQERLKNQELLGPEGTQNAGPVPDADADDSEKRASQRAEASQRRRNQSPTPRPGMYRVYRETEYTTVTEVSVNTPTPLSAARSAQAFSTYSLPTVEEVSAGGVIVDMSKPDLPVAIIARYNRGGRLEWCLPKGHPEGVETNEQAAEREVEEETGIQGHILTPLGSIDYWFTVPRYRVHKTVHHYLLQATGGYLTIDKDPDHEAVDVAWVPLADLTHRLSFPNERRIAQLAREALPRYFKG
ncbi:8-oxo-dGTP pyrophosphatase MutT (NUDIX family) [Neomicrococcus lactis]|uniref:8-oxo-dGTP pyrophosphatase MutT (NUDIX family) n=2 Tax=Neomicrococcus lactis TaxID=732241 RepID=A0A7W9DC79_9MICC|nr:8-oxo-dGTP pyrophosphatase MutT (NUDIX family) [Neomicrococcus lactis]